jgi:hypothetical protein
MRKVKEEKTFESRETKTGEWWTMGIDKSGNGLYIKDENGRFIIEPYSLYFPDEIERIFRSA